MVDRVCRSNKKNLIEKLILIKRLFIRVELKYFTKFFYFTFLTETQSNEQMELSILYNTFAIPFKLTSVQ